MTRFMGINLLGWTLLLTACVTINVYFPSVAAEKAADNIINDVLQHKQSGEGGQSGSGQSGQNPPKPAPEQTAPSSPPSSWNWSVPAGRAFIAAADFLIPPAAAAPQLNISSPVIKKFTESLKSRFPKIKPYLGSGAVGLTHDGLLAVRDLSAAPLSQRNQVRQLVSAQNENLRALYQEIARANGHPEWTSKIQQTFARRWVAKAPAGWYYQDENGQWHKK